jgi:hypothetical protein
MNASLLAGAVPAFALANGARMPSTADDVCAETRNTVLRADSERLRRYGLDSLSVMRQWYSGQLNVETVSEEVRAIENIAVREMNTGS